MDNTPGEALFTAYLRQRRLPWKREPLINGRKPDFLVHHPSMDFTAEVYEPELQLPQGGGFIDSYSALRRGFQGRKSDQIKAMREAGVPCVLVIARTHSDLPFRPEIVAGAMFGDVGVNLPLDDPEATGRTVFLGGGRVQPDRNRGLTAVAVLESFNPTLYRAELAVAARLGEGLPWYPSIPRGSVVRSGAAIVRVTNEVYDHMVATGDYIPTARVAKLTVLHNPYAAYPLHLDILDGPYDTQWSRTVNDDGEAAYGPVKYGALVIRNPSP